jgi:hypothetical protein
LGLMKRAAFIIGWVLTVFIIGYQY